MAFSKQIFIIPIMLFVSTVNGLGQNSFDDVFINKTLRVDFVITGDYKYSDIYLDEIRREPHWAGPQSNLIDPFDYGEYKFEIITRPAGN